MIATASVVVVSVIQELCQHLLDIIQGFLLSPESFLLCFHAMTEVIIIIVIDHVS